jgi:hypothetical protein
MALNEYAKRLKERVDLEPGYAEDYTSPEGWKNLDRERMICIELKLDLIIKHLTTPRPTGLE